MVAMKRLIPLAAVVALAACGGSAQQQPDRAKLRDAALKFARCMREHGVDVPDPKFSGGGMTVFGGPAGKGDVPSPTILRKAQAACQHFMAGARPPSLSPAERAKVREQALANARCMRQHGVDFPDPQFGPDGGARIRLDANKIDPTSPLFKRAQEACKSTMPGFAQTDVHEP